MLQVVFGRVGYSNVGVFEKFGYVSGLFSYVGESGPAFAVRGLGVRGMVCVCKFGNEIGFVVVGE